MLKKLANRDSGKIPKGPTIFYFIMRKRKLSDPGSILSVFQGITKIFGKVCAFRSGFRERTYLVSDAAIAHKIFTNPRQFAKYPFLVSDVTKLQSLIGKGLLATHSDEEWYAHRKQMVSAFKPSMVFKNYYTIILKHLVFFLSVAEKKDGCQTNFSEMAILFSGYIISEILSPCHDIRENDLLAIKDVLDKGILEFHHRKFKKNALHYKQAMLVIANRLLESYLKNKEKSQHSLIARMASAFPFLEENKVERQALLERLLNIIVAGYETTATSIAWVFLLLAQNASATQLLYEQIRDIDFSDTSCFDKIGNNILLQNVIKEAMRIYPALWFNIRYCTEEAIINGIRFNKHDRIMLLPFISNKDPDIYPDPHQFIPERFNHQGCLDTFGFGHGPRSCAGKALAEMEIKMIVAAFVKKFTFESIESPQALGGVLLHPKKDIIIKLHAREVLK